jgi:hypothetical protein
VGFVVEEVALGQAFLSVLEFSPLCHSTMALHTNVSSETLTIGPLVAIWRQSHPIHMNKNISPVYVNSSILSLTNTGIMFTTILFSVQKHTLPSLFSSLLSLCLVCLSL